MKNMGNIGDVVSASEIASWCPESWRLEKGLHLAPGNERALIKGEEHHAEKAGFEKRSRSAMSLGVWLLAAAAILAVAAFLLRMS